MKKNLKPQFASDNYAGICPDAWEAMAEANQGFVTSYGDDNWTLNAADCIRELFDTQCEIFFVFNGTAANSLAIASLCQSYHSVIAHESAHIETDECGGVEFFTNGTKILTTGGDNAKLNPEMVERLVSKRSDIHFPSPRVLSITQSTELGTVYKPEEIRMLSNITRKFNMKIHMDGARFANAVASLGVTPAELTWKNGVDVLCFGGTKNGMAYGEVVIFFDSELAREFDYRCKQSGQLASKMRFISSPWVKMIRNNTWLKNAEHSNRMAKILYHHLKDIKEIDITVPCEANAVFVRFPDSLEKEMKDKGWHFYNFIGNSSRLMCSWATTEKDIEEFVLDIKSIISRW